MKKEQNNSFVKEQITHALLSLMKHHPFEDITITEIVKHALVSRASFYRNFINKEDILKLYQKGFERDSRYLSTYYGIHKEDMKIFIDNKSAHQFASQGQQRTIVLSMKIALIELIKEEIGEYPILLLDDVLSELDDQRKTKLLDILNNRIQTFITTTSIDGIEHHVIKEAKKININHREEK